MNKAPAPKSGGKTSRSWLATAIYWFIVLIVWGVIAILGVIVWYAYDLPPVDKLSAIQRKPSVTLLDRKNRKIAEFGDVYGVPVQLNQLPKYLPNAVVATEDRRFYNHYGIDPIGLTRAMVKNVIAGRVVQGGSTISQQLAKNVFLTHQRTLKRKVQEFLLALWLEATFSKEQILTLYLNRVYFGAGAYGVDAAARRYFSKPAAKVNLAEAAMLAGLLKAPSRLTPTRNLRAAQRRAALVLTLMADVGYIKPAAAQAAKAKPADLRLGRRPTGQPAYYFSDWIIDRLTDYLGPTERNLVILTTLDREMQHHAERVFAKLFAGPARKRKIGQGALLAMAPNGAVRAMVGGRDYGRSQYNRATQARRQPGSAFKPVVFLAGLELGLRPDTTFNDKPITVNGWSPKNYANKYRGQLTFSQALAYSSNSVAVQVSERVGRDLVVDAARRLGMTSRIATHPSIALGTAEVGLLELTTMYASLANQGLGALPHGILEVRDDRDNVLYQRHGSGRGQVARPWHVAELSQMLVNTIQVGTGRNAKIGRPAAGKTGTSQDHKDAWFVGYTSQLVAGIWLGNDNGSPMNRVTGGGVPARLWRDFMIAVHKGLPAYSLNKLSFKQQSPQRGKNLFDRLWKSFGGGSQTQTNDTDDYNSKGDS